MGVCCLVGVDHASLSMLHAADCAVIAPLLITQQQSSCVDSEAREEEQWRLSPRGGLSTDRGLVWLAIKASLEFGVRYLGGGGSDLIASLDSSHSHQTNILQRTCLEFPVRVWYLYSAAKKSVGLRKNVYRHVVRTFFVI